MKRLKRILKLLLSGLVVLILILAAILGLQFAWTGHPPAENPPFTLLSHRAVHHDYQRGVYDVKTGCEAKYIFPPSHTLFGNTIPSIKAAIDFGADVIEIDIRRTADSNLVVYHDYDLSCRTDGKGLIRDHPVSYLKTLDVGYGYTADSGATFPLRGLGKGLMVTLEEVLEAFPDQPFMIDHKDWDQTSLRILFEKLTQIPPEQRKHLYFWSSQQMQEQMLDHFPEIRPLFLTKKQAREEFGAFVLSFGMMKLSEKLRGKAMALPAKYLPYVWGWPYRFLDRVHAGGIKFYVMTDDPQEAQNLAKLPIDGIITDHIETVGPALSMP